MITTASTQRNTCSSSLARAACVSRLLFDFDRGTPPAPSRLARAPPAAGAKDPRFALPNARIMIHQPSGGFQGQATDIMLHAREILNMKARLNEIYVKHTGQPLKKIEDAVDTFLTAEMARDFGIVDKVIDRRLIENSAGKE